MNLKGIQVEHKAFGSGVVEEHQDSVIRVRFQEYFGEKLFIYPDAFEQFLSVIDPSAHEGIELEIRQRKLREDLARQQRREEEERQREESRQKKLELDRLARKRRATAKAGSTRGKQVAGKAS